MNVPPLVVLTPGRAGAPGSNASAVALRAVATAVRGGVRGLVVREPQLEDGALLAFATVVAEVLRAAEGPTWLCIHDRPHLAGALGADAVHLAGRSLPPELAARVVPEGVALGRSTHAGDDPTTLDAHCAYALHAPVFAPNSKPAPDGGPLGLDGASAFAAAADVPVLALGGIDATSLETLARHDGARAAFAGVACIGGVWGTELRDTASIEGRARALATRAAEVFA